MSTNNGYNKFFKQARTTGKRPATKSKVTQTAGQKDKDIVQEVVEKVKKARPQQRKKFPVLPFLTALIGLLAAALGFVHFEKVEKILTKIEVKILGDAVAADGSAKAEGKKDSAKEEKKEGSASAESPDAKQAESAPKAQNGEQSSVLAKLDEKKKQLDEREAELAKLEEELQKQRVELESKIRELETIRGKIASDLEEKVKVDQEKVTTLVDVYSNMKPANAAKVFETMNEDLAVEVLTKMKKKSSADILNLLTPEKAQRLTEKFAGYKRK